MADIILTSSYVSDKTKVEHMELSFKDQANSTFM